jgi:sugar lactone lactonase YvrE
MHTHLLLAVTIALAGCASPTSAPAVARADLSTSSALGQTARALSAPCASMQCIYYSNPALRVRNPRLLVFAANGTGDIPPLDLIHGPETELRQPRGIAVDDDRNIYVAEEATNSISVYAAGSDGDAAPIRTIRGDRTFLVHPQGIAVDARHDIYVANNNTLFQSSSVTVYGPHANGNAAPIQNIAAASTGLNTPEGIAVDDRRNIYVADFESSSVTVYAAGATGQAQPIQDITGADTRLKLTYGIAVDPAGNIYVTNLSDGGGYVNVYASGATGDAEPIQMISGGNTRLNQPSGVALDAARDIFVVQQLSLQRTSILVFAAGSNGNVAPSRIISGGHADMTGAGWIAVR